MVRERLTSADLSDIPVRGGLVVLGNSCTTNVWDVRKREGSPAQGIKEKIEISSFVP